MVMKAAKIETSVCCDSKGQVHEVTYVIDHVGRVHKLEQIWNDRTRQSEFIWKAMPWIHQCEVGGVK